MRKFDEPRFSVEGRGFIHTDDDDPRRRYTKQGDRSSAPITYLAASITRSHQHATGARQFFAEVPVEDRETQDRRQG